MFYAMFSNIEDLIVIDALPSISIHMIKIDVYTKSELWLKTRLESLLKLNIKIFLPGRLNLNKLSRCNLNYLFLVVDFGI